MFDSIIILGATATGKTAVSISLAKMINSEIINADSMYIYKDLNVGTAKPSIDEMNDIKHHLIDIIDPDKSFNVSEYREYAKNIINDFKSKGMVPIIVGGTGFYIDSLIKTYTYGNTEKNELLRRDLQEFVTKNGKIELHNKLNKLSPVIAQKIHFNDVNRVIRAIEILTSGHSDNECESPILSNPLIIGLSYPREILYNRINNRVDTMIDNGLLDEVIGLCNRGLDPKSNQSMRGIGYKEIYDYLNGLIDYNSAIDKIKQHTRNYAKRQITWFKRNDKIIWFDMDKYGDIDLVSNAIYDIYIKNRG